MKPVALIAFLLATTSAPAAPDLILAETWQGQDVRGWAMSEKLDGVRAYWDGHQLNSRTGYPFPATGRIPCRLSAVAAGRRVVPRPRPIRKHLRRRARR